MFSYICNTDEEINSLLQKSSLFIWMLMVSSGAHKSFFTKQAASMVRATCPASSYLLVFANCDYASITNKVSTVCGYVVDTVTNKFWMQSVIQSASLFFSIWYLLLLFPYHLKAPALTMKIVLIWLFSYSMGNEHLITGDNYQREITWKNVLNLKWHFGNKRSDNNCPNLHY